MDHRAFVRKRLEQRGWSQGRLARETGILPQNLSRYLRGHRDVRQATKDRIDNALKGATDDRK